MSDGRPAYLGVNVMTKNQHDKEMFDMVQEMNQIKKQMWNKKAVSLTGYENLH